MNDIRESILEGEHIELVHEELTGWYARIGRQRVRGRTAAEVLLNLADIVLGPASSKRQ